MRRARPLRSRWTPSSTTRWSQARTCCCWASTCRPAGTTSSTAWPVPWLVTISRSVTPTASACWRAIRRATRCCASRPIAQAATRWRCTAMRHPPPRWRGASTSASPRPRMWPMAWLTPACWPAMPPPRSAPPLPPAASARRCASTCRPMGSTWCRARPRWPPKAGRPGRCGRAGATWSTRPRLAAASRCCRPGRGGRAAIWVEPAWCSCAQARPASISRPVPG